LLFELLDVLTDWLELLDVLRPTVELDDDELDWLDVEKSAASVDVLELLLDDALDDEDDEDDDRLDVDWMILELLDELADDSLLLELLDIDSSTGGFSVIVLVASPSRYTSLMTGSVHCNSLTWSRVPSSIITSSMM
jgi:hypothetical protein